jgi:predicted nucleic acid-binding protein
LGSLIDSSVFIAAERGKLDLQAELQQRLGDWVGISSVTASELLHGVHRASTPDQRARREAFVEAILSSIPVVAFDLVVARVHALLDAELAARGARLGAHDLQIAATALAHGHAVATRDEKSFPKIPGLTVERW